MHKVCARSTRQLRRSARLHHGPEVEKLLRDVGVLSVKKFVPLSLKREATGGTTA